MQDIHSLAARQLAPGVTGHYVHGENLTFGYVHLKQGSRVPLHSHPQEQSTYLVSGQLDMQIGDARYSLTPGMVHVIPANTLHDAYAVVDTEVIDTFSPAREDYR
ncbi:MAG TPA: cupin domain-containing protein [Chitinophagaceae bacterium]|nr:cupin domain-containing protein [Chitinophagaceae bacterium]